MKYDELTPEQIAILNAPLYIDVYCYSCGKHLAMSNAQQFDGRYFCNDCYEKIPEIKQIIEQIRT